MRVLPVSVTNINLIKVPSENFILFFTNGFKSYFGPDLSFI